MALLSPQRADADGVAITYASASASDTFAPDERGVLLYRTSGTGSTVTIVVPGTDEHAQARPDVAVTLASTEAKAIATAPFKRDTTSGLVTVTSSSQTGLTVAYVIV
jgi:hypothetical protein